MRQVVCVAILVLTAVACCAGVIRVPEDYPDIKTAMWEAQDGDTVLVGPGTYAGPMNTGLSPYGKSLTLRSAEGPEATIIQCQGSSTYPDAAFFLHNAEDSAFVIDGFQMTGAYAEGAIICSSAVATIKSCIIRNNHGDGIYMYRWSNTPVAQGPLTVVGCDISHNTGDGVFAYNTAIRMSDCTISHNDSMGVFHYATGRDASFSHLLINNNGTTGLTEIINMVGNAQIDHVTIVENEVGLLFYSDFPKDRITARPRASDSMIIRNCVVAFNEGRGYWTFFEPTGTVGACNNAYGNTGGDYYGSLSFGAGDTLGNISANPLFCDRLNEDFHLAAESPCAPANNSCGLLMGRLPVACVCCTGSTGNVDGDAAGVVDISDLSAMVDYLFFSGSISSCTEENDVDASGSIDISDLQALIDFLFFGASLPSCP
jgi:hypothetical protein